MAGRTVNTVFPLHHCHLLTTSFIILVSCSDLQEPSALLAAFLAHLAGLLYSNHLLFVVVERQHHFTAYLDGILYPSAIQNRDQE